MNDFPYSARPKVGAGFVDTGHIVSAPTIIPFPYISDIFFSILFRVIALFASVLLCVWLSSASLINCCYGFRSAGFAKSHVITRQEAHVYIQTYANMQPRQSNNALLGFGDVPEWIFIWCNQERRRCMIYLPWVGHINDHLRSRRATKGRLAPPLIRQREVTWFLGWLHGISPCILCVLALFCLF